MSYSCTDFYDDVIEALGLAPTDPNAPPDNLEEFGERAVAEIERLKRAGDVVFKVSVPLLRKQKLALQRVMKVAPKEFLTLDGILNLLDAVHDAADPPAAPLNDEEAEGHADGEDAVREASPS